MPKQRSPSRAKTAATDQALTRVVLSSHHALVRSGLRTLLEETKEMEVREAANKEQLLTLIKEFQPHAILIEVTDQGSKRFEVLQQVVQEFPSARALALTQQEDEEQALEALNIGAAGLIARTATRTEFVLAIATVARGEHYVPEALRQTVLKDSQAGRIISPKLTSRQYEVLKLIAEGRGTKEIALRLHVSPKTVETHRARIMRRLNIHDVAGLVRYAVHRDLITLEE